MSMFEKRIELCECFKKGGGPKLEFPLYAGMLEWHSSMLDWVDSDAIGEREFTCKCLTMVFLLEKFLRHIGHRSSLYSRGFNSIS